MKQGTFESRIFIRSTVEKTLSLARAYERHHNFHPLIVKVDVEPNPPVGVLKRYFITDQLQWGPFRFKIKYRADILSVSKNDFRTEAYQSPGTTVLNHTTVTPTDDGVTLGETITLRAPSLLFGYAFQQAKQAHAEMLKRLKDWLEAQ
ncbi:MAG: hypothetical protein HFACDABA_02652 [Anaerolineales bacterium]|nr:hypothetical protein [Anaerolineales bacterium]